MAGLCMYLHCAFHSNRAEQTVIAASTRPKALKQTCALISMSQLMYRVAAVVLPLGGSRAKSCKRLAALVGDIGNDLHPILAT
jgi:hypothetical protein